MDAIIKPIEKMKPFFDKVARNKYLKAIKDGFISSMPIILFFKYLSFNCLCSKCF